MAEYEYNSVQVALTNVGNRMRNTGRCFLIHNLSLSLSAMWREYKMKILRPETKNNKNKKIKIHFLATLQVYAWIIESDTHGFAW